MSMTRAVMVTFNQHNGSLWGEEQPPEGQPSLPVSSGRYSGHLQGLSGSLLPHQLPGIACRKPWRVPSPCPPPSFPSAASHAIHPTQTEKWCLGVHNLKSNSAVIWGRGQDLLLHVKQWKGNLSPWSENKLQELEEKAAQTQEKMIHSWKPPRAGMFCTKNSAF